MLLHSWKYWVFLRSWRTMCYWGGPWNKSVARAEPGFALKDPSCWSPLKKKEKKQSGHICSLISGVATLCVSLAACKPFGRQEARGHYSRLFFLDSCEILSVRSLRVAPSLLSSPFHELSCVSSCPPPKCVFLSVKCICFHNFLSAILRCGDFSPFLCRLIKEFLAGGRRSRLCGFQLYAIFHPMESAPHMRVSLFRGSWWHLKKKKKSRCIFFHRFQICRNIWRQLKNTRVVHLFCLKLCCRQTAKFRWNAHTAAILPAKWFVSIHPVLIFTERCHTAEPGGWHHLQLKSNFLRKCYFILVGPQDSANRLLDPGGCLL